MNEIVKKAGVYNSINTDKNHSHATLECVGAHRPITELGRASCSSEPSLLTNINMLLQRAALARVFSRFYSLKREQVVQAPLSVSLSRGLAHKPTNKNEEVLSLSLSLSFGFMLSRSKFFSFGLSKP